MYSFRVDDLHKMNERLRGFAEYLLSEQLSEDDIFLCRLVSSELIANVIKHGSEAAEFKGEIDGGEVVITVLAASLDGVALNPELPDVFAENGRGMYIVKSVCSGAIEKFKGGIRVYYKIKKSQI